eukprot:TRINITY_DN10382_c0_g1_i1.p1 TRINITY_DN10382_c0_g1~~TRINITY_DN10382_c0_g1_i1.p1  ORF type:complete len:1759 (-),score=371.24 TRINITY_DN10382_c0_g1_i1:14-5290(-)
MRSSLKREVDGVREPGKAETAQEQENAIRRAYRNIARRYRKNIFNDPEKFDFQMRILNLAKEAMVRGEGLGADGWGEDDEEDKEDANATKGPGRELPGSARASDDILRQMHSWQEYALEEGVRFDDPDKPFFIGHTQHAFRDAFASNWSHFLREDIFDLWPAAATLQYQVELDGSSGGEARAKAVRLAETARQIARDALASVSGVLHECGGRDPPLAGPLPESGDSNAWVELQLKASRNLRALFAGVGAALPESCAISADREARAALLELNLEALQQLGSSDGDGHGRADVAQEIRAAHAAASAARSVATPLHCQESATLKRTALEKLWEEYQFGPLVDEAYPSDPCGLQGLAAFLEFHIGRTGELLARRAEPDRTVLRALRGLLNLQRVLARPASISSGIAGTANEDESSPTGGSGTGWRGAITDVEEAVWKGIAFPELHTAVGKLMAEIAAAGLLPDAIAAMLEHPPVTGGLEGTTLPHGREPGDIEPVRQPRFVGMDVPGYSMKPVQRYEERALRMWGDEEVEDNWDPVRLGLSYIDLTPACDLPLQVAMCFLSAALWMWRALQLLGDNCGGDGWLDTYVFEEIWSAPPEAKRVAMQFSLKRAVFELVEYAANMADHGLLPGARLAVQRTGYLLLRKVSARFGTAEDAPKVMTQLRRFLAAARLNPLWAPPLLPVSDSVFIDILSGRLHSAFLEKFRQDFVEPTAAVLPSTVPEYTLYEASLLGGGDADPIYARYEVMGALIRDTKRRWSEIEALMGEAPLRQDPTGFVLGAGRTPSAHERGKSVEFAAVRGLRIDFATGAASILLARPSSTAPPLLSLEDAAAMLAVDGLDVLQMFFDPPSEKGVGMSQYPHHPFQSVSLSRGAGRRVEAALLHAGLTVQQLASGTEVSFRAPFPLRSCTEGLCKAVPRSIQPHLQPIPFLRNEAWDSASRLVLECPRIPYWQEPAAGNILDVRFGEPQLQVHPGKQLHLLNEEEFKTWPVPKLRAAVQRAKAELGDDSDDDDNLPELEKQELVDRLLRYSDRGVLIEDEEELKGEHLFRFSRRLTHHLPALSQRWRQLARLVPLCALRAAGMVMRMQLEQMNESSIERQKELESESQSHADRLQSEQRETWRAALAEVHANLLQQLGFIDLDPGGCFTASASRSFARCCSVGDYAAECWPSQHDARQEELRCCGPAARRAGFNPQLLASVAAQLGSASPKRPAAKVLIPAVEAWLQEPTGQDSGGKLLSANVVELLAEDFQAGDVLKQQTEQVQGPAQRLSSDLAALDSGHAALMPDSGAPREAWLPVPPLSASGGRRTLYTAVALAPQLMQLDDAGIAAAKAQAASSTPGPLEEITLEALSADAQAMKRVSLEAEEQSSSFRALQEAASLVQALDQRSEELEAQGGWQKLTADLDERQADSVLEQLACGPDGWRELRGAQGLANISSGSRVRVRRRNSEDVCGTEATVEAVLALAGEPGVLATVWELSVADGSDSRRQYLDLTDPALIIGLPCTFVGANLSLFGNESKVMRNSTNERAESSLGTRPDGTGESTTDADTHDAESIDRIDRVEDLPADRPVEWPACIEVGVSTPSLAGLGLFVNLEAIGIKTGCFKDDCSHSDHFAAGSPADCARTCAKIGACRSWSFWEAAPSTCWLRGASGGKQAGNIEAGGAVSGSAACQPPREEVSFAATQQPSLFALLSGRSGTLPPDLWQETDLIGTLEEFGHLTLDELRRVPPSDRQRTALRAVAVATSGDRCGPIAAAHGTVCKEI